MSDFPCPSGPLYVYGGVVDLRKSSNGLRSLVEHKLSYDVYCGGGFVFVNRSRSLAKVLWWDRTGWCLLCKRLERGSYRVSGGEEVRILSVGKIKLFFDGI